MKTLKALASISRVGNCLMAATAVGLGFWLGPSPMPLPCLFNLMIAAVCATAFGNAINDLLDISTDRISHPNRPLVTGDIPVWGAVVFAIALALGALSFSFFASTKHAIATLIPLAILVVYSLWFKRTPLVGNVVVASLVAYPVLFGALGSSTIYRLFIPAVLAFLLNVGREIIKDLQDAPGDRASNMVTTAAIPASVLRAIVLSLSVVYLAGLFLPAGLHHFGITYSVVCAVVVIPIHATRSMVLFSPLWESRLGRISTLFKLEMLAGLVALAADQLTRSFL